MVYPDTPWLAMVYTDKPWLAIIVQASCTMASRGLLDLYAQNIR